MFVWVACVQVTYTWTQCFPEEHESTTWSVLLTSAVSGFNVVAGVQNLSKMAQILALWRKRAEQYLTDIDVLSKLFSACVSFCWEQHGVITTGRDLSASYFCSQGCGAPSSSYSHRVELIIWPPNKLKDLLMMAHFPLSFGSNDSLHIFMQQIVSAARNHSAKQFQWLG